MNYFHPILDADRLTDEQIKKFMEQLGFVESSIGCETVWLANLSVSIRVNTTKGFNTLPCLKKEIYKRVAYHRDEFLKQLDSILLFCLSDMQGFDPKFTKEDTEKRIRLGIDQVKPQLMPKRKKSKRSRAAECFDL